ncbi:ABC transporter permease/substrate-binding protein [Maricaulis sp. CAU 1757]
MNENFAERLAELPDLLSAHLILSLAAILVGTAVSVPLGILAASRPRLAGAALNVAGVIQTIPGLALLALMVPLLGGMIGFWPAFLALTLYSVLPILRNTIVGLRGLDATIVEAARGLGLNPRQQLWQIELPLALPVVVAGLRTAVVWVVGAATLATSVGATSLGNYIFAGLQTRNWLSVMFGVVFAAGLAIILDQMVRLLELAARDRRRGLAAGVGAALALLVAAALVPGLLTGSVSARSGLSADGSPSATSTIQGARVVVGAKAFTEQYILAALIEQRLEAAGARVERRDNLGSTIAFDALRAGEIDAYVDYTGTIWATLMERDEPVDRYRMYAEVSAWLWHEHGIMVLGRLGFENAYGFAMSRARAEALGIASLADLGRVDEPLSVGGDPEVFARSEWRAARDAYGLGGLTTRAMDSTFMYGAVRDGRVDVVTAYTTDGRIAAFDLVVLDDPLAVLPPYDAILLLSPQAAQRPALARALAPLVGAVDDAAMREANRRVDLDGDTPARAAAGLAARLDGDSE